MSRMRNRAFSMLSVSRSGSAGPMVTLGIGSGWPPLCRASIGLAVIAALDLVDPIAVHLFRAELQVKALAHDAGQETPYRVLLPTRGFHHRVDRGTHRRSQHCNDMRLDLPCSGLRSFWLCVAVFVAAITAVVAAVRFLADFNIEILHSVSCGSGAAPPKPHRGGGTGGAGSQSALGARD